MHLTDYLRHPAFGVRKLRWWLLRAGAPRDVTVETFNGRLTFDSRDKLTGKRLFIARGHEVQHILATMRLLEREGYRSTTTATLLEVGANIGMTCIAFVRRGFFRSAVAFEPAPDNFRLLQHNIAQNGLAERIRAVPWALSSDSGEMPLELSADNWGDHRIRQRAEAGAYGEEERPLIRVPVRTLDAALVELGVAPADVGLTWVDIQGHEGHLFRGTSVLLAHGAPLVTEFWPYGIRRSGVAPAEYCRLVGERFTHFYVLGAKDEEKHPVERLGQLFETLRPPGGMEQLLLLRTA